MDHRRNPISHIWDRSCLHPKAQDRAGGSFIEDNPGPKSPIGMDGLPELDEEPLELRTFQEFFLLIASPSNTLTPPIGDGDEGQEVFTPGRVGVVDKERKVEILVDVEPKLSSCLLFCIDLLDPDDVGQDPCFIRSLDFGW